MRSYGDAFLATGRFMRAAALLMTLALAACASGPAPSEQAVPVSELKIPAVASLSDGVWLKGDLHLHSRHSKESSNNPVSKIIAFADKVGVDFIAITDHDNHVDGDVAH